MDISRSIIYKSEFQRKMWRIRSRNPEEMNAMLGEDIDWYKWYNQHNPYALPLERLMELCEEHFFYILSMDGDMWDCWLNEIKVRVIIIEEENFEYLTWGDFFFKGDEMYMYTEKYRRYQNRELLGALVDEMARFDFRGKRRYAVKVKFAGLYTGFKDVRGKEIYVGDVIDGKIGPSEFFLEPEYDGTRLGYNSKNSVDLSAIGVTLVPEMNGKYEMELLLDNHYIELNRLMWAECIGTVFYELDVDEEIYPIGDRCLQFISGRAELREKCKQTPSFSKWDFQKDPYRLPLTRLKELCDECFFEILQHKGWIDWRAGIEVRVVIDEAKFGYLSFGEFFFVEDRMYMISDKYDVESNASVLGAKVVEILKNNGDNRRVKEVIYAGLYTGYTDLSGSRIYTGDVVNVKAYNVNNTRRATPFKNIKLDKRNQSAIEMRGAVRLFDLFEEKSNVVVFDNVSLTLGQAEWVKRIGTMFYDLDKDSMEAVDIHSRCLKYVRAEKGNEIWKKSTKTPSFKKTWQQKTLEMLGEEPKYKF